MKEDYFEMNELACGCRRQWKIDVNDSIDIFSLAINKMKNLTIVFKKMDDDLSGACLKLDKENIIFVNSKHRKGRQAFTIAHELYHLKYDENNFNICALNSDDEIEKKADLFASCLIMPHGALESYKLNNGIEIPMVGFGTWDVRGKEGVSCIRQAIDLGYRLIDTAIMYGNEKEVCYWTPSERILSIILIHFKQVI